VLGTCNVLHDPGSEPIVILGNQDIRQMVRTSSDALAQSCGAQQGACEPDTSPHVHAWAVLQRLAGVGREWPRLERVLRVLLVLLCVLFASIVAWDVHVLLHASRSGWAG
jgi:hypothetical protein